MGSIAIKKAQRRRNFQFLRGKLGMQHRMIVSGG
jgi:hypothetical protein